MEAELTGPQYVREQLADMLITTERIEALVADVITCVQDDVDSYLDVEGAVVSSLGKDVGLLVNLFGRLGYEGSGKREEGRGLEREREAWGEGW